MISSKAFSGIQRDRMNAILRKILNNKRITRNGLAELLRLSPSSIVKYTKTLMELGLLKETGQQDSSAGRKSTYIELNPETGLNIALLFSVTEIRGGLVDPTGNIHFTYSQPAYQGISKDEALSVLNRVLKNLFDKAESMKKRIFGIGIGIGGYLDPKEGISHEFLYSRDWYDVGLKELIESQYKIPCFLVNDANACALGDKYYGYGVGVDNFLSVMMDEGIGLGIVVNGEIYLGFDFYAGEFGHNNISGNTNLCYCGHTGCLETVSSKSFILSECRAGLKKGVYSEIIKTSPENFDELRIEQVIEASNKGDRFSRNIFEHVGENVGYKLSDIINVLNPELIIFRGSIIDGNEFLFETIKRIVVKQSLRPIAASLRMVYSEKQEDIAMKGVSSIILRDYFST